jgi:uncharacterized membrane protein AbrB (regulator of aidB expression)
MSKNLFQSLLLIFLMVYSSLYFGYVIGKQGEVNILAAFICIFSGAGLVAIIGEKSC